MTDLLQQEIDRVDNAILAPSVGRENVALLSPKDCVGLEVGVDTGALSRRFLDLDHFSIFHSVDKWDDHAHSEYQYRAVSRILINYEKSKVWRMTAQDFAEIIPSSYLGFVYIDCYAHTGQDDGAVLDALWPKLQEGGIFAGDDYDEKKWPKTFAAVNRFAKSVDRHILISYEFTSPKARTIDSHPTWWFRK